jgi:hypothetical protein
VRLRIILLPRVLLPLCSILLLPGQSLGQVPFDACLDRQDRVIPGVIDNTMPYAGMATERYGQPVILWNQKSSGWLSTTEQIFIYLHECAHHTLGHLYRQPYTPAVELEADCWAIQLMVDGGMIKGRHLGYSPPPPATRSTNRCSMLRVPTIVR